MAPNTSATQGSRGLNPRELAALESWLQRDGYRLVAKTAEQDLLPGEYIKRSTMSVHLLSRKALWQIVWIERKAQ